MSSISSVSGSSQVTSIISSATSSSSELSETTKKKLEALGIDPSTVQSEAQAQTLIAQAEAAKNQGNNNQQGGGSQEQLMSEVKTLAQAVGVSVSSQDTLDGIINNITEKLQEMAQDPSKAKVAQQYQSELAGLTQRADAITSTQQNIFNSMNMVSVSNKLLLGL